MKRRALTGLFLSCLTAASLQAATLTPLEQLGRSIFFDNALSIGGNQSCAACHGPTVGWTGPSETINQGGAVYEGSIPGRFGNRKPPSSAYATQSSVFHLATAHMQAGLFVGGNFWDGRATGERLGNAAADQAQGPFLNPVEQALPTAACVLHRVCTGAYGSQFTAYWGAGACAIAWPVDAYATCAAGAPLVLPAADYPKVNAAYDDIALSIAAYEASPESNAFTSKYDRYVAGAVQLTAQEKKGLALFRGKGRCARCHVLDHTLPAEASGGGAAAMGGGMSGGMGGGMAAQGTPGMGRAGALFTDYTFDNLGIPRNPDNPFYAQTQLNSQGSAWVDQGLGGFLATRPEYAPYAEANVGKHKVPTLRNVDLRPSPAFVKAYGHNGYFKSLKGIVHFYNTRDVKPRCANLFTREADALAQGCWPAPEVAQSVNAAEIGNLRLSSDDEDAIVAFMKTLSDGYQP